MQFAIFDLDHTLLPIDSGDAWTHFIIEQTGSDQSELKEKAVAINQGYRRGDFDAEDAVRFQMGLLSRFPRAALDAHRETFLETVVWPQITDKALALVEDRRRAGFECVLASGTHRYVSGRIAERFGIKYVVAATPEEDGAGNMTGALLGSHSYREGKVALLKAFLEEKGAEDAKLEAYSDSINDLPLLTFVAQKGGRAVAVNADDALRAEAQKRGWETLELFAKGKH